MADEGPSTSGDVRFTVPTRLKLIVTEGPCEGQIFDAAEMDACFLTLGRTKVRREGWCGSGRPRGTPLHAILNIRLTPAYRKPKST